MADTEQKCRVCGSTENLVNFFGIMVCESCKNAHIEEKKKEMAAKKDPRQSKPI